MKKWLVGNFDLYTTNVLKSLESVDRISLYYRLQTPSDSKKHEQIKFKFSEDISEMTTSGFVENQFVPNDLLKNPFFIPKMAKLS